MPIVPLHVNVYLPPQPTPARCHAWGAALGEILRARPERVALIASGGMSHFPGTDRYASPEFDYDRALLDLLRDGRGRELARVTGEELDKRGNIELRTWITLLGAVGDGARGRVLLRAVLAPRQRGGGVAAPEPVSEPPTTASRRPRPTRSTAASTRSSPTPPSSSASSPIRSPRPSRWA